MADKSAIEWTDATWNPVRGCSRVSEGCRHCYAERVAYRFSDEGQAYHGLVGIGGRWNGTIRYVPEHALDPLKWKKSRRIFVNSMSDLFHENVPNATLDLLFAVMALAPQHTFQVLTKRPERMRAYCSDPLRWGCVSEAMERLAIDKVFVGTMIDALVKGWPLPNVWLGVSVEDQKAADERIPLLLQTPAAVRFISAEPLLGPVNLDRLASFSGIGRELDALNNGGCEGADLSTKLDWVIVGGESGPGARPMHPGWARNLRDQCQAASVPFFFKQWGEWIPWEPEQMPCWVSQHGKSEDHHALFPANIADDPPGWDSGLGYEGDAVFQRVGKKAAGHLLDGKVIQQFPEVRAC